MTKEEYAAVCKNFQIEFRETIRTASQEQLELKAQLLQKYYRGARTIVQACNTSPEITIYSNGKVVSIYFLGDTNYVFWMDDVFPNFPEWKRLEKNADFFPVEQTLRKVEEIIGY